jgi:hypothetical protein
MVHNYILHVTNRLKKTPLIGLVMRINHCQASRHFLIDGHVKL